MPVTTNKPLIQVPDAGYALDYVTLDTHNGKKFTAGVLSILDASGAKIGQKMPFRLDGANHDTFYNAWSNAAGFWDTLLPLLGLPRPTLPSQPDNDFLNTPLPAPSPSPSPSGS